VPCRLNGLDQTVNCVGAGPRAVQDKTFATAVSDERGTSPRPGEGVILARQGSPPGAIAG